MTSEPFHIWLSKQTRFQTEINKKFGVPIEGQKFYVQHFVDCDLTNDNFASVGVEANISNNKTAKVKKIVQLFTCVEDNTGNIKVCSGNGFITSARLQFTFDETIQTQILEKIVNFIDTFTLDSHGKVFIFESTKCMNV